MGRYAREANRCSPRLANLLRQYGVKSRTIRTGTVIADFEERAAIPEYEGGLSRPEAEAVARLELGLDDDPELRAFVVQGQHGGSPCFEA